MVFSGIEEHTGAKDHLNPFSFQLGDSAVLLIEPNQSNVSWRAFPVVAADTVEELFDIRVAQTKADEDESLKGKHVVKQSDKRAMAVGFVIIVLSQNNRVCPVVATVSVKDIPVEVFVTDLCGFFLVPKKIGCGRPGVEGCSRWSVLHHS